MDVINPARVTADSLAGKCLSFYALSMPQLIDRRLRRSERKRLYHAVLVRRSDAESSSSEERTRTLVVSPYGALVTLLMPVELNATCWLTNLATHKEKKCRVVHVGGKHGERTEIAIAFVEPSPDFWSALPDSAVSGSAGPSSSARSIL